MFRERPPVKYPGLAAALHAAGGIVAYMTAYQRLNYGWTLERAVSTPTHVRKPRPPRVRREVVAVRDLTKFAWERPDV